MHLLAGRVAQAHAAPTDTASVRMISGRISRRERDRALEHVAARLQHALLLAGRVVLGVLGEVAELARALDLGRVGGHLLVDDLVVLAAHLLDAGRGHVDLGRAAPRPAASTLAAASACGWARRIVSSSFSFEARLEALVAVDQAQQVARALVVDRRAGVGHDAAVAVGEQVRPSPRRPSPCARRPRVAPRRPCRRARLSTCSATCGRVGRAARPAAAHEARGWPTRRGSGRAIGSAKTGPSSFSSSGVVLRRERVVGVDVGEDEVLRERELEEERGPVRRTRPLEHALLASARASSAWTACEQRARVGEAGEASAPSSLVGVDALEVGEDARSTRARVGDVGRVRAREVGLRLLGEDGPGARVGARDLGELADRLLLLERASARTTAGAGAAS